MTDPSADLMFSVHAILTTLVTALLGLVTKMYRENRRHQNGGLRAIVKLAVQEAMQEHEQSRQDTRRRPR